MKHSPEEPRSWHPDFATLLLVVAALVIVAFLTFEMWAPHVGYHR
jgi:hypothetical protein